MNYHAIRWHVLFITFFFTGDTQIFFSTSKLEPKTPHAFNFTIYFYICTGGIIGLGEAEEDRVGLLHTLATLPTHPESVPINALVPVKGTPLQDQKV